MSMFAASKIKKKWLETCKTKGCLKNFYLRYPWAKG